MLSSRVALELDLLWALGGTSVALIQLFTFSSKCLEIWHYVSNLTELLDLFEKKKIKTIESMMFYRILKPGRIDVWEQYPHKNTLDRLSLLSAALQPGWPDHFIQP